MLTLWSRRRTAVRYLVTILGLVLVHDTTLLPRKLPVRGLASYSAIIGLCAPASRLLMRDNIVCRASLTSVRALAIGHLVVCIVWIWVLQDDVPSVEEAGKEAETAERNIDEGVCAAESFLDPYTNGWEEDAEEHQEAVGAAHDGSCVYCWKLACDGSDCRCCDAEDMVVLKCRLSAA